MTRVAAVALNTFRETIRDRMLVAIVMFALVMIVMSMWLASISLGQEARLMKDFGLVAVSLFGLIVAVFVASSLVRKEVDKRTVFVLFSKPVGRGEFILGKFLGLALTTLAVVGGMGVFLFLLVWIFAHDPAPLLLLAAVFVYLQLVVVMAVTIMFSTLVSPVLAMVFGVITYLAGQLSHNALSLTKGDTVAVFKFASRAVFVVVPNLSAIDVKPTVVGEGSLDWASLGLWSLYAVAYMVVALTIATLVFRRKEF